MPTSIRNLEIRQGSSQFSHADSHMTFAPTHDDQVCVCKWNNADPESCSGSLRHSGVLLTQKCNYDAQELFVTQSDCSRMTSAVSNGSYLSNCHKGPDTLQQLAVNSIMDRCLDIEQLPRIWPSKNLLLDVQEYQHFVENMTKFVQPWPVKHHFLAQASQTVRIKHNKATGIHTAAICFDHRGSALKGSSQTQEEDSQSLSESPLHIQEDDVEPCHLSRKVSHRASISKQNSDVVHVHSSTMTLPLCEDPQPLKFPIVFPRTSRRRSLNRRRALQKVDGYNFDATENTSQASSFETKTTEFPSLSHGFGPTVESPKWLPPGWFTEMKTRANGSTAGSKYKCYVDPVTRRRFRTRKEVFCFLRTGNTGRYKPRPNVEQDEEQSKCGIFSSLDCPASQFHGALQGTSFAGRTYINGLTFLPKSWHYRTGRSTYGDMVDIQAAALKLLTDDDDMTLDEKARLFARFSPRPTHLYGLRIPAKSFKKIKVKGKEALEALGKVICQQGLSILRKCEKKSWQES